MGPEELIVPAELHAGKRRGLVIGLGNLLLLVVMLGVPWVRGYFRTRALWDAFARYEACLYGGEPRREPGLGMPQGHEAYFATRALREPGWAAACDDELSALAPDEALFIMPGLKVAEADLRAAVKLVRAELAPLSVRTPGAHLSTRPLRALDRLRAGLANHALATGIAEVPEGDALVLPKDSVLPVPARLPLYAGRDAAVSLWGSDVELHALALDSSGVSYVHLRAGKLEQTRAPRPGLLQSAVPWEQPRSFVWAMSQARCAARSGGCADKALGVAAVQLPALTLPAPRWLGAHPHGRPDRSIVRSGERILVVAEADAGRAELREFGLASEAEASASADLPPLAPTRTWKPRPLGQTLLLEVGEVPRALNAQTNEGAVELAELTATDVQPLAKLEGKGAGWVVGCAEGRTLGFAFGHDEALVVGAVASDGVLSRWPLVPVELASVVDERAGARDRVVRVCGFEMGAAAVVLDRGQRLRVVRCLHGAASCSVELLATSVRSFATLAGENQLVVAYAGSGKASQVRVRSTSLGAAEQSEEQVPSVCWSDARGLCGAPVLARIGGRIVLGAREATDLMLLESSDWGASWRPLKGLGRRD